MKSEFLKSTVGLKATGHGMTALVKIEAYREGDVIALRSVSGHNLGRIAAAGTKRITADEWENVPHDYYDSTVRAKHLMRLCGWSICGVDDADE